jgi:hypothetical protein
MPKVRPALPGIAIRVPPLTRLTPASASSSATPPWASGARVSTDTRSLTRMGLPSSEAGLNRQRLRASLVCLSISGPETRSVFSIATRPRVSTMTSNWPVCDPPPASFRVAGRGRLGTGDVNPGELPRKGPRKSGVDTTSHSQRTGTGLRAWAIAGVQLPSRIASQALTWIMVPRS